MTCPTCAKTCEDFELRVLLLSKYGTRGASSRLRSYQYLPILAQEDIRVKVSPLFENRYLEVFFSTGRRDPLRIFRSYLNRAGKLPSLSAFDLIWIEKEVFPWLPATIERQLARNNIPYIVDYDDAVFHRYDQHPNRLVRKILGRKIDRVMGSAKTVIVGNQYLAKRAHSAGAARVVQIPTAVDLTRYRCAFPRNRSNFTIGWIGTPHTARYLPQIEPALREVASRHRLQFVAVGAGNLKFDGVSSQSLPWSEHSEAGSASGFDVGVMPLQDEPFERGKCGYKLVQYMACGVPVVASPVGANKEIVEPGHNGFLAATQTQWIEALEYLIRNPENAKKMGLQGRRKVEEQYCLQVTAPRLTRVIREAVRP